MLKRFFEKYKSEIVYLVFGVLTTAVNYLVSLPCYHYLASATVSNAIAWVFAVLFAYLTNKPFVFQSHDWSLRVVAPEFAKFVGTRVASLLAETAILHVAVDLCGGNFFLWKLITSVLVVILNYIGGKLLVFRGKKK